MKKLNIDYVLTVMGYKCYKCNELFFSQHISEGLCCPKVLCVGMLNMDGYYEFKNAKE